MAKCEEQDPVVVDLRGLKCPLPALFARRALERAAPGTPVTILADDPLACVDVPHMCHQQGFEVLALRTNPGTTEMVLRRSG